MAHRRSFGRQLPGEVQEWVREGLVSQPQSEAILARYARERGTSRQSVQVIAFAGSVLVSLGIILIIAHNWDSIHHLLKLAGLFALLAGAHYAGWRFRFGTPSLPRVGEAFLLMGGILFLAGIGLVSQIYHLNARPPNGVLIWLVGIAALPWLARSAALQALTTAAFVAWLGMEAHAPDSWIYLGRLEWTYASAAALLGGALFLLGERERAWPVIWSGRVVTAFGLGLFAGGAYVLGFIRHAEGWYRYDRTGRPWLLIFLFAAFLLLLAGSLLRADMAREGWGLLASFASTVLLAAAVGFAPDPFLRTGHWRLPLAILFWALQIAFALCLIWAGVGGDRPEWVNLGAFLFALQVITRYFDLFTNMLDTGLLFLLGGVLLLGIGILTERKRRQLLAGMAAGRA